jgi:rod shape-determining protein MreD
LRKLSTSGVSRVTPNVRVGVGSSNRILNPPARAGTVCLRGVIISYLSPLLAILVGIVHAALAPVIVVGGVKPNLVLVAVVLVTLLVGLLPGITWAFTAGLTANLLVGAPLGSIPLAMLLVAVLVGAGARLLGRVGWIYPIAATFVGSIVADLVALGISQLVTDAAATGIPVDLILAAATLNAAIAAILLYPARFIAARYVAEEAPAW